MTIRRSLVLAVLALVASGISADEGRIPIYEPVTLTEPGHYVLTRTIQAGGAIITIEASALEVYIDLNGFFIWRTDTAGPVIDVVPDGEIRPGVHLRNGAVAGGQTGIDGGDQVVLRNVGFFDQAGSGIDLSIASSVTMTDCTVANSGQRGIILGSGSHRIVGNEVRNTGDSGIELSGSGALVVDNIVHSATKNGISITGDGNRVSRNTVRGSSETSPGVDGDGIYIEGSRNLVEDNHVEGNPGFGIVFAPASAGNAYRGNMLRGNGDSVRDDNVPPNTDAGGNIP